VSFVSMTWLAMGCLVLLAGCLWQCWLHRRENDAPAWGLLSVGALLTAIGTGREVDWWFLF
jgi:hypothetical protein